MTKYLGLGVAVIALVLGLLALQQPIPTVGSASSPSVVNGCMDVNGVTTCSYSRAMRNASTTCSFKAPLGATSTLVFASARVSNAYSGSFDVEWGKSTDSAYATTTSLGLAVGIAANTGTFMASTTGTSNANPSWVFGSGDNLNLKIGSTSPTVAGTCNAVFVIN